MSHEPITNDSFLALLDELRDELEAISAENTTQNKVVEDSTFKCHEIVDVIAADFVAKNNTNTSGFTHISKAKPTNTLNNDVLYIGINKDGFACVFNVFTERANFPEPISCYYTTGDEVQDTELQMEGLVWWKVLERPNYLDFNNEGFDANIQSNITNQTIDSNPYPKDSREYRSWRNGWLAADDLPF